VSAIYNEFAGRASHVPPVAAFWREMAADERIITAARELFAPTESPPPGEWARELVDIEELVPRPRASGARAGCGARSSSAWSAAASRGFHRFHSCCRSC